MVVNAAKQMVEAFASFKCGGYPELLERGEEFKGRVDSGTVPHLKSWAKRHKPRAGQCYMNAQRYVIDHPNAKYYEGYWYGGLIPVHHGWVVEDGVVVDMTAEDCDRLCMSEDGKMDRDPAQNDYFGLHVPTEFLLDCVVASEVWGPVSHEYLAFLKDGQKPSDRRQGWKMSTKERGKARRKKTSAS